MTVSTPTLTGRFMYKQIEPGGDCLIYESDEGPLEFHLHIWQDARKKFDVEASVDWEDWCIEDAEEARYMSRQAIKLSQWLEEVAELMERLKKEHR